MTGISARACETIATMGNERRHYPVSIYALTVLCTLGLAAVALGVADGWALIAAGVTAITVSLARLHVILNRRRAPGKS